MASVDRGALEALFRSTGGEIWKEKANWTTGTELSTWHGVKVDEDGRVVELRLDWDNNLQGPIPGELGALTELTKLNLSFNNLTGPMPEALGALTNLTQLYLGRNKLTGPILGALGFLTRLKTLFLSHNQLTGPIPEALGDLTNLKALNLSNNKLTGPIPGALGALTNLTKLNLGSNELSGPILGALGAFTKLTELVLGGNQLTGTVPLSVWKLPYKKRLDLTGNLLTRFTDAEEKTASTRVVLDCMERLDRGSGSGRLLTAGNPWEFPPAAVVANGRESVRKYYDTWEQCDFNLVAIHALKVVFVGAYGAGKTSLARSVKMGRGDRTPEADENRRTTVGVDLHSHTLRNGTECKIYDVAGQITYYGLHQFFLTERAVCVIVSDATRFEGLGGEDLDEAIEDNIMEWVSLLHMRTPLCTVMLVASHYDELHGAPEENEHLLWTVEQRFMELQEEWKSLRDDQNSSMDERMTILPGILPVGCRLATESISYEARDGLQAVDEALSKQKSVASSVPPSWVAARQVLEQVGSTQDSISGGTTAVAGLRRPWELRSVVHTKFESFVEEGRRNASQREGHQHPASCLSRLRQDGIRDSMDGAIELRAFSGTVISHDMFVVLDVMWLAGVLKPILDHRGVTKNKKGKPVFADRVLGTSELIRWASELLGRGILRKGFARLLWSLHEQVTEGENDPVEMEPAMFEDILERIGVTIPLPGEENLDSNAPPSEGIKPTEDGTHDASGRDNADLLVIMRLPLEADAETRRSLVLARQAAFPAGSDENGGVKAVFEFDHAGAPHGLPERVMALSHRIGVFSSRARWRLGGLFLLHNRGVIGASSMILEYDKKRKTLCIEALGQSGPHLQAVQFVISALFHVARDFPGASWAGWVECGMGHDDEKMYLLATSNEKQNQTPGSEIVPLIRDSPNEEWREQRNMCGMQGLDARGSCTLDPDVFGRVVDVTQPLVETSDKDKARSGDLKGRNTNHDPVIGAMTANDGVSPRGGSPLFNSKQDSDGIPLEWCQTILSRRWILSTTSQRLIQIAGDVTTLTKAVGRVEGGIDRVEGGIGRVEKGIQKIDEDIQRIARRTQESLLRLKNLQAPNYPYPHLVAVKEIQTAERKRSLWCRFRGVFVVDMTLHFVCPFDMSKVPCGDGGNGYRLRKTRGWVKKISPALQVTVVTAKVALRAVAGVDFPGMSDFLHDVKAGLVEELGDRTLDEDVLSRVASGDEDARPDMQRVTRASCEAIKVFMEKEESKRRKNPSGDDGYIDFRSTMERVNDEKGGLVWVRNENVQEWSSLFPTAAPST